MKRKLEMDESGNPNSVDEWIRALAEAVSLEARMHQMKDARFSKEDVSETIEEYELIIRAHLKRAGLLPPKA